DDAAGSARQQRPRGLFPGVPGSQNQHVAARQLAEDLLRQFDGDRADRDAAALDIRVGADVLGDIESGLESFVEPRPSMAGPQCNFVGLLELAKYLGLAQHHRVQAAGYFEEMAEAERFSQPI